MNNRTLVSLLLTLICFSCHADWQFRISNRLVGNAYFNPGDESLLQRTEDATAALENRIILQGDLTDSLKTELQIVTTLDYSTRRLNSYTPWPFPDAQSSQPAFRHPDLQWEWKDTDSTGRAWRGITDIDRLNLQWNTSRTALTLGRQAIGLSTCFYLTTNDFFQPMAPEAIYREYKTGVDALNFQYYTGPLSEIDLITVAGYDASDELDWDESAVLARSVFSAGNFEWTIMGGKLPWRWLAAAALQGEVAGFGVRAECNINFPEDGWQDAFGALDDETYVQIAGGVDYRFENSFHVFVEYLYRDTGYENYRDYLFAVSWAGTIRDTYSGQNYLALAASYQWHPLVTSQLFGISNIDDESILFSGTVNCSLADEADLIIGGYHAVGDEPRDNGFKTPDIPSQYGATADSIYLELRVYI